MAVNNETSSSWSYFAFSFLGSYYGVLLSLLPVFAFSVSSTQGELIIATLSACDITVLLPPSNKNPM